jgi:hydroxymethylpyrimidine/phosphomethylpyrimidine kinase
LTAITAQNSLRVTAIQALPVSLLASQVDVIAADVAIGALKSGMLATAEHASWLANWLQKQTRTMPYVLDPVLRASTGDDLGSAALVSTLRAELLPLVQLLTPNLAEAGALINERVRSRADMLHAAQRLRALGASSVLLKGGHLDGQQLADVLLDDQGELWFEHPRQPMSTHGTGCALSAAITAGLAKGKSVRQAVGDGIVWLQSALMAVAPEGQAGRVSPCRWQG